MEKVIMTAVKAENAKAKDLRKSGFIPAIVYGPKSETIRIKLDYLYFVKALRNISGGTMIDLSLDGKVITVLLHELQRDPVTERVVHVDFYALDTTKPIHATIPLHFEGDPEGVRIHNGILVKVKDSVEVKCLSKDLMSSIIVDINCLTEINSAIHVADLKVADSVTLVDNPELVIVHVVSPKVSVEETTTTEVATPTAEAPKE